MAKQVQPTETSTMIKATKVADYIVEREFKSSAVHQGYIEPHNARADEIIRLRRDELRRRGLGKGNADERG